MVLYVLGLEADGLTDFQWVQVEIGVGWIEQICRDALGAIKVNLTDPLLPGQVELPNDFRNIGIGAAGQTKAVVSFGSSASKLLGVGGQYRAQIQWSLDVIIQRRAGYGVEAPLAIVTALIDAFRQTTYGELDFTTPSLIYKRMRESGGKADLYEVALRLPFTSTRMLDHVTRPSYVEGWGGQALSEATMRDRFKRVFEDVTGYPVVYDNEHEDPPDGTPWIRLAVNLPNTQIVEPGPRAYELRGNVTAAIMVPTGSGIQVSAQIADDIFEAMRTVSEKETTLALPVPVFSGRRGKWWQTLLVCPVKADEVVT